MQLKFEPLMAGLAPAGGREAQALPALVWIHGEEPLLILEACDAARAQARAQGMTERKVFEVDRTFKWEELQAELGTQSLFAENRLIGLRCASKPGKELGEALAKELSHLDENTRL